MLLYILRGGGTTDFFSYIPGQNLTTLAETPDPVGAGGSLVFNEADGNIYALRGDTPRTFGVMTRTKSRRHGRLAHKTPVAVSAGGSLTFNTQDGFIYAFAGGGSNTFMKYDNATDLWTVLPPAVVPKNVGPGGSLTSDTTKGFIYALVGGGSFSFYNYSYLSDSWVTLADFPKVYPRPITIEILDSIDNSMRLIQDVTDPYSVEL